MKKKVVDPEIPECVKKLNTNRYISMYIITHCTEDDSNKVYIFAVIAQKRKKYLARFWGRFGSTLMGLHTLYDQDEFQKLINQKGAEGYHIVDNKWIAADKSVYGPYADSIATYANNISTAQVGVKTPLT
jgi:hypothetical protein